MVGKEEAKSRVFKLSAISMAGYMGTNEWEFFRTGALYYGTKVASGPIPSWANPSPTPATAMLAVGAKPLESTPPPHVIRGKSMSPFLTRQSPVWISVNE